MVAMPLLTSPRARKIDQAASLQSHAVFTRSVRLSYHPKWWE